MALFVHSFSASDRMLWPSHFVPVTSLASAEPTDSSLILILTVSSSDDAVRISASMHMIHMIHMTRLGDVVARSG